MMPGTLLQQVTKHVRRVLCSLGIALIIGNLVLIGSVFTQNKVAHANTMLKQTACQVAATPTGQSLLIVLLDRSGSLTFQPGATDPDGYSTSVTNALADLWPGNMAVIPFSNDTAPIIGPVPLNDLQQKANLKSQVDNYPITGNTPLRPAVQEALDLLQKQNTPAGSRVVIITDGNPTGAGNNDGPHQEQAIRTSLIPRFCQLGVPVSTFGLTIDLGSSDGKDANSLLSDIAKGTNAPYTNVTSPIDLAKQVIKLYAQWQDLTFSQVNGQNGNYPIAIDTFAKRVSIVTFRSDQQYAVKLLGPNQQVITQGLQLSSDRHYVISNRVISGPGLAGTYTVNTGSDPNAQVYDLIDSPLKITVLQPTATTVAYTGKPVTIQAQFINDTGSITPEANTAVLTAKVTLLVNGRAVGPSNTIILTQQKTPQGTLTPAFAGATLPYTQIGQLQIEVQGTYQQASRQQSLNLQLLNAVVHKNKTQTQFPWGVVIGSGIGLIGLVLLGLILLLVLRARRARPMPYGYLTNGKRGGDVALTTFTKPAISSNDIQARGLFNFSAGFELVFTKDGIVQIRTKSPGVTIDVAGKTLPQEVTANGIELKPGRKIYTNGYKVASFETSPGRLWT